MHGFCAILLFCIAWYQAALIPTLGYLHWFAAIGFTVLLVYQHFLVYKFDLLKIDRAFFETNGIASLCFGTIVIIDVLF